MFIVLDAIDGAGKGHQRLALKKYILENTKLELASEEFPVHNAFYETVIHPALQEEVTMNSASWVLSYLLDKTLEADKIVPYVGSSDALYIADGYFTTTIAYQSLLMEQVPLERLLGYSEEFNIPKPDLCIFLDTDPEVAFKRKDIEEGHDEGLDMFEKSIEKQRKLKDIFNKMHDEQIYSKWVKVDGNGTPEEVTSAIIDTLKSHSII